MTLQWVKTDYGYELIGNPLWKVMPGCFVKWSITLSKRPSYCDRGRWLAQCDAPLDSQEGWPRYYFNLASAKSEIALWVSARRELK